MMGKKNCGAASEYRANGYGLLMASTSLALILAVHPVGASETSTPAPLVAQATPVDFNIPAQSLTDALAAFGRQSGMQVSTDANLIQDKNAPAVTGRMAPEAALNRLLAGSGIVYRMQDGNTALLSAASDGTMLDPIRIEGQGLPRQAQLGNLPEAYAGGQVARGGSVGFLGNRDVMDTAFNTTNYTSDLIEDQQAATLADVLANDPSVRVDIRGRGTNNGGGDQMMIRGFRFPNSDASMNGLFGVLPSGTVPMETVERVEVLKGPNALLNGMAPSGGVGGSINIVPKRAEDEPITRLTANYLNDLQGGGHVDLGRRFGNKKEFGIRMNGVYRNGDTAVEDQTNEVGIAALALDYRGDRFRVSVDLGYQDDKTDVPSSWGGGIRIGNNVTSIPDAPDANDRTAQLWEYVEYEDSYGVVNAEFDVASNITVYGGAGTRRNDQKNLRTSSTITANDGTLTSTPSYYPQFSDNNVLQGGARATFHTGEMRHELNFGASMVGLETGYAYSSFTGAASNLYNVANIARPNSGVFTDPRSSSKTYLTSLAVADTMVFADERVWFTVGARRQRVEQDGYSITTGTRTSSYDQRATTPVVGAVVKPWRDVSIYGNYIEGLTKGNVAGSTYANAGEVFAPSKTTQKEVGVKFDFENTGLTVSAFEIQQPNYVTKTGAGGTVYTLDGMQRNRGVEISAFGEPKHGLRILGGATLLEPLQTETQGGTNDGNVAVGVPRWMANFGAEWDAPFAEGLTFSGRTLLTGKQYANASNTLDIPAWYRFDVGARYKFSERGLEMRANIINLFDSDYWESAAAPQGLRIGAPRTVMMSMTMEF